MWRQDDPLRQRKSYIQYHYNSSRGRGNGFFEESVIKHRKQKEIIDYYPLYMTIKNAMTFIFIFVYSPELHLVKNPDLYKHKKIQESMLQDGI